MAALVPHVSEQRAIRLPHRRPPPLALRIVSFGDVDGDDAVGVPGQQRWAPGPGIGEELEREPVLRIVGAAWHGQTKLHQREQQAPLGAFEAGPRRGAARISKIGDDARDSARRAERAVIVDRHRPIARPLNRQVGAEPVAAPSRLGRTDRRISAPSGSSEVTTCRSGR